MAKSKTEDSFHLGTYDVTYYYYQYLPPTCNAYLIKNIVNNTNTLHQLLQRGLHPHHLLYYLLLSYSIIILSIISLIFGNVVQLS